MARRLALLGSLVVSVAVLLMAATAAAGPPLRLELNAPFGEPLGSGWVQTSFWERDAYKLKGALSNTEFRVWLLYWVDSTTCYGPPTNDYRMVDSLWTDARGNAGAHYRYTGSPPAQMAGRRSGVQWVFLYGPSGRVGYTTSCTTIDLR